MIYEDPRINWFKENRNALCHYINDEVRPFNKKFKLVHAPVKSGKRGMVEIYSLLDKNSKHIFLTALHRKADEKQRDELTSYGIHVYSVNNKNKKDDCIKYIEELLLKEDVIKIHLDELDFGCGNNQLLNNIWSTYKTNPNVYFVLYSATIEVAKKEFLLVNNINDFYECKRYIPPPTYFGIKNYLQHNKFFQAVPFIDYNDNEEAGFNITVQGEELIQKLINNTNNTTNKRHIGILRLAGNFKIHGKLVPHFEKMKENKEFIENKYGVRLKFVGSNDNVVEWDDEKFWEELSPSLPFIIVINQVSGRSTEWKCHPFVVWYHTLRTDETPIGTIIQDQERPVRYTTTYTDEIDIEIYGDLPCAKYSAGEITLQQLLTMTSRKINSRLDTKNKKKHVVVDTPLYYNSWNEIPQQYRVGKSLSTHVNDDNILKHKMSLLEKVSGISTKVEYEIKNWNKHSHLEGFYMTNIRSSRVKFIKGKSSQKSIWFKSDIQSELNEGINEKSKIRINLIYEDKETNPNNYKFIVRRFKETKETNCSNTTMYNI
jgi:hypothetical protein